MGPLGAGGFGGVRGPMLPGFMPNAFVVGRKKRAAEKIQRIQKNRQLNVQATSLRKTPFSTITEQQTCTTAQMSYSSQAIYVVDSMNACRRSTITYSSYVPL
jgi:hypothetical protein